MASITRITNPTLDAMGFDEWGARSPIPVDINSETVETNQQFSDLGIGGEKIAYLSVDQLIAGTLRVDAYIQSGQTAYDTGTGFWLGNDNGTTKFSLGDSSGNKVTWDGSTLTVRGTVVATNLLDLGNGSDGAVTISVDTTLTRDMQYTDLTVNSTKILNTAGFSIRCTGTLTNNGTIRNNGTNGGSGFAGAAGVGGAAGSLAGGGDGGAGAVTAGAGAAGTSKTASKGGNAGAGGGGGVHAGGAAGTATTSTTAVRAYGVLLQTGSTVASFTGGGGGGGGAANSGGPVVYGGGGGGGGGAVDIACRDLVNAGTISANGGNGANGDNGGFAVAVGGGGGGGGGFVRIAYINKSGAGTITASAGTKGLGATGGADGSDGSAGTVFEFDL